jgi:hypothetical protein
MKDLFAKFETEYLKFDRIEHKMSTRPDLHAFMLLDVLVPGTEDMVSYATHDEITLSVEPKELEKIATENQLRDLHRCGVRHSTGFDTLEMFT